MQENVSVGIRVKAKVFIQDPFNPALSTEDEERYVDVSNTVCALTCYNYREDILSYLIPRRRKRRFESDFFYYE